MTLRIAAIGQIEAADVRDGLLGILLEGSVEDVKAAALLYGAPVRLTSAEIHSPDIPRALEWLDAIRSKIDEAPRDVLLAMARNARTALTGKSE